MESVQNYTYTLTETQTKLVEHQGEGGLNASCDLRNNYF
jgi:hypothetical protein